ncbi:Sir2 family NAD-dependent protein deacetylase [uncultured Clostridium sp.]|uniref:SIR2 family NAD-dependent protein deacylase n=1 Tax=uncultured Clostridium sp. TaxID=59620 RepID=UPI0025CD6963|nr:Sir2 family NAD-dependent protein deacetylase [uncultured Clostridium sp.]
MKKKIERLKRILEESTYTVALCGSGMMEEGGFTGIKKQDKAYDIESRYGHCVEELYSATFYNTRPEQFFEFYKSEMLHRMPHDTATGPALAAMERAGRLQSVINSNIYDKPRRGGCEHVINLHGSIYQNQCPRCGKEYPVSYIMNAKHVPLCEDCRIPVRPMISLFGEMVDSQKMTSTTEEITKADTLLLLGTTLASEVFHHYIQYFEGRHLVIIHKQKHYLDEKASLVILDHPMNILPLLGYGKEEK